MTPDEELNLAANFFAEKLGIAEHVDRIHGSVRKQNNFFVMGCCWMSYQGNVFVEVSSRLYSPMYRFFFFLLDILALETRYDTTAPLRTLAHEMVHAKQLLKGELQYKGLNKYWKGKLWKKKLFFDYSRRPWEIEARELETILYDWWLVHKKQLTSN